MTCFYLHYLFILLLLLFGHAGCRILAPQTGIEAVPPVVEEKNLFFFFNLFIYFHWRPIIILWCVVVFVIH